MQSYGHWLDSLNISDLRGHIAEACVDQGGSRFIQEKYESSSQDEKAWVLEEVQNDIESLTTNVYGNYVI